MQTRILIVDDDQDILSALKKRLTWMGHEVVTSEDGEQALKVVAEEQPDLMLLDIELPGSADSISSNSLPKNVPAFQRSLSRK